MLGLPDDVTACLFDLDGVLTKTAAVHAEAWKQMFDSYLPEQGGQAPFDAHHDYDTYVDGKPRSGGIRDFLASRGLHPDDDEVGRVGDIKNALVLELIKTQGVGPTRARSPTWRPRATPACAAWSSPPA